MDSDGGGGGSPTFPPQLCQRCNVCFKAVKGRCFRTTCRHIFCDSCAFEHFGSKTSCGVCGAPLREADVKELVVGTCETATHFGDEHFTKIYKSENLPDMGLSLLAARAAVDEGMAFVMEQMALVGQREASLALEARYESSKLRIEKGEITMKARSEKLALEARLSELEKKLELREREHLELQEAYRQKLKKCQAWERAYKGLKSYMPAAIARPLASYHQPMSVSLDTTSPLLEPVPLTPEDKDGYCFAAERFSSSGVESSHSRQLSNKPPQLFESRNPSTQEVTQTERSCRRYY